MHDPASHAHVHARTEVTLSPSLLRLSAVQRLAIAIVLATLLWVTVARALMDISA